MWTDDADGKKKGFALIRSSELVEFLQCGFGGESIWINVVVSLGKLDDIHFLRVSPDFSIGKSVHNPARVQPFSNRLHVANPGIGHFNDGIVVPVGSTETTGMVRHFSD